MSKYHSAEIWENNAEVWEKIIFCRGDMGKNVKNHKRRDRGDIKFPLKNTRRMLRYAPLRSATLRVFMEIYIF
jgi:hypothetical protein